MKIIKFTPENSNRFTKGLLTINFRSRGPIIISSALVKLLDINPGDGVAILQDEDSQDDYFISKDPSGFICRSIDNSNCLLFFSTELARRIINQITKDKYVRSLFFTGFRKPKP